MNRIVEVSDQYGLDINTIKTKLMVISKKNIIDVQLIINQTRIERVNQYTYLGTILMKTGITHRK